jgi:hypothetical protein
MLLIVALLSGSVVLGEKIGYNITHAYCVTRFEMRPLIGGFDATFWCIGLG